MYIKPEIEICNIEVTDIIVTSFNPELPIIPGDDWSDIPDV